eukprot:CAMPEP_0116840668 /NCGR_PEP_ID=MMETSP0418-20121206/10489_1 /TAXON_ID=1158023 /ORGANISM="Astrosyne radiata, Strain 13vi08-1A" /LENGTH=114 /DNA_ID=CAMNT_0004470993 /DNA_START=244 /DNA_END=588 /DNA_ORIENTATION=-
MQNESGENVDLYVPRKCSWTNRLVPAKDHSSVQINVAHVDPVTGIATSDYTPYCLAGYIRFKSEGDMALTALVRQTDANILGGGGGDVGVPMTTTTTTAAVATTSDHMGMEEEE